MLNESKSFIRTGIYLSNILFRSEYPERIPIEHVKKYSAKDLMEKMNQ